jgi:hypothetical protein
MITIGCTIFFNKCQEVDTVLNTVFLGVPNPISEDIVKEMVDKVLQKLEKEQIKKDSNYKIPLGQKDNWIWLLHHEGLSRGYVLGGSRRKEEKETRIKQLSDGVCIPCSLAGGAAPCCIARPCKVS